MTARARAREILVSGVAVCLLAALAPVASAAPGDCSRVIGFSQTRNWFIEGAFEQIPGIQDSEWELLAVGGADLHAWADPSSGSYARRVDSPCGIPPTRVVFQAEYDGYGAATDAEIAATLTAAIANIRTHWPTVGRVDVVPIVGGPGHAICPLTATRNIDATLMHPRIDTAIAAVANGIDILAGPHLLASSCADFSDGTGHLTATGSAWVAQLAAAHYVVPTGNNAPRADPLSVTTERDTAVEIFLTGSDADGDPLTFAIVTGPTHGSLGPIAGTGCTGTTCTARVTYTPSAGFGGSDGFTYRVSDGLIASAPANVDLTIGMGPTALAFRSSASAGTSGATTLAISTPAGVQPGDVLVGAIAVRGNPTVVPPAGWTLLLNTRGGNTMRELSFVHVVGGSEPAISTWTFSSSQSAAGGIAAYVGVDPLDPVDVLGGQANASSTQVTAPSVTTTGNGRLLVGIFGIGVATALAPPSSMLERIEVAMGSGRRTVALAMTDEPLATPGATGTRIAVAGVAGVNVGQVLALRPATG